MASAPKPPPYGAAVTALALVGCDTTMSTARLVKVTIAYEDQVDGGTRHLSPGVWVLVGSGQDNPLFTKDSADGKAMGLEPLAETGMNGELAQFLAHSGMVSGMFAAANTGATGMTSFNLIATPGSRLYFATMVAPSNDWFAAPAAGGIDCSATTEPSIPPPPRSTCGMRAPKLRIPPRRSAKTETTPTIPLTTT